MNTLKTFKAVLVILVLSILAGCSDQITSSLDREINPGRSGIPKEKVSETGDQVWTNLFSTRIKLGSNREYTFSVSNTGLSKFFAIGVENLSVIGVENLSPENEDKLPKNCGFVSIYGDKGTKNEIALSCQSKGFDVKQVTLKNLTSRILDLNVYLQGVRIDDPGSVK